MCNQCFLLNGQPVISSGDRWGEKMRSNASLLSPLFKLQCNLLIFANNALQCISTHSAVFASSDALFLNPGYTILNAIYNALTFLYLFAALQNNGILNCVMRVSKQCAHITTLCAASLLIFLILKNKNWKIIFSGHQRNAHLCQA